MWRNIENTLFTVLNSLNAIVISALFYSYNWNLVISLWTDNKQTSITLPPCACEWVNYVIDIIIVRWVQKQCVNSFYYAGNKRYHRIRKPRRVNLQKPIRPCHSFIIQFFHLPFFDLLNTRGNNYNNYYNYAFTYTCMHIAVFAIAS